MRAVLLAAALVLGAPAEAAETRFMNLSQETVSGRKVITKRGVYIFHTDGRYSAQTGRGRTPTGRWRVEYGNVIRVTYPSGLYTDISTHKIRGSQKLWFIRGNEKRQATIVSIVPE